MKKLLKATLIGVIITTIFVVPTFATTNSTDSINNPYVREYLKEKLDEPSNTQSKEYLVDPQVEERIIISALQEYYNEDVKVANILEKYYGKSDQSQKDKVLSLRKEDKVEIMKKIKDVYFSVNEKNDQEIFKGYFKRYARDSKDKEAITFLNEIIPIEESNYSSYQESEQQKKDGLEITDSSASPTSYQGTYSKVNAGNWAYNNYNNYSTTSFPAFTNDSGDYTDCANFVSRAMNVGGGMQMQGTWYCYKKNSTYPNPKNATELNYSWNFADPSPWISAREFESFWASKVTTRIYSTGYYISNHDTIYNYSIFSGDAVIFRKGVAGFVTVPTHVMIISSYDTSNKDFKLAGHSRERQAYPLLDAVGSYSEVEFICF